MVSNFKRALISVSDKTGILDFAKALQNFGIEILSTGGTYKHLIQNGVKAIEVADVTQFPEILDGRVKTLHPNIHAGILARRGDIKHQQQLQQHGITPIDIVCVNLYPFEATINQKPNCSFADAIENIDIGGPAMIRASSKNHQDVVILTNPNDYAMIITEIEEHNEVAAKIRLALAQKAFSHTAYYDSLISNYLAKELSTEINFASELTIPAKLSQTLRYGENSHQVAAFYTDSGNIDGLLASFKQLQGKELSYNNLADADTAWECVRQFKDAACVIVKHANPCGVAVSCDLLTSYTKAFSSDPVSSFGGIIAFNQEVTAVVAENVSKQFVEVLLAPGYTDDALAVLAKKINVRVLQIDLTKAHNTLEYKRIGGGLLVQSPEAKLLNRDELTRVTQLKPSDDTLSDLEFAWNVARFVKSNAIVLVKDKQTIGIGAGQMSRIDSTKIAMTKAREFGFTTEGAVCASDAFFPFRDNVDLLATGGISAIIQPGGSIRDEEVFAAANELNMSMILTGYRTFRH